MSLVAVLAWSTLATVACSVDSNGLGSTPKLSHDAGPVSPTGGSIGTGTGGAPQTGTGGAGALPGTGGNDQSGAGGIGDGTGGSGDPTTGAGGVTTTGGTGGDATGAGGMNATGGAAGSATTGAGGASMTGAGGAAGAGGAGMTGAAGARGMGGAGGAPGRCGPANCNGCCAGTVCVPAPTPRQCGSRGVACVACGACQLCSAAGQCALDPGSQWTIVVENARVTTLAPNGGFWDPAKGDEGGVAPDLFCEYENPANEVSATTAGVTATVQDVYSAAWNTTITPAGVTVSASALMAVRPAWRIWVGDEDCSKPNMCGQGQVACSYQQPISAAALTNGRLSIANYQNCLALNLLFTCASPAP
ncbi:MAG: hypothetical protein ABUS79_28020 [Pseudomonadota bacterium]